MGNTAEREADEEGAGTGMAHGVTATHPRHHKIVALEGFVTPIPDLTPAMPPGHSFELKVHDRTPLRDAAVVAQRLATADIAIITITPLTEAVLAPAATPHLRHVAVMASGYDSVDLATARPRGIVVSNSPACNVDAVAQHALALHLAARRRIGLSQTLLKRGLWPARGHLMHAIDEPDGQPPLPMGREMVGILGHGGVGRKIAALYRALGVETVLVAGRKGAPPDEEPGEGRTRFDEVLRTASTLFLCVPRSAETLGLISRAEFASMRQQAIFVNVSRGSIVDEAAALEALRAGRIAGYATDVFATEPAAPENSVLVQAAAAEEESNLVISPHTAWCSEETTRNYQQTLIANIRAFLEGKPQNVVS